MIAISIIPPIQIENISTIYLAANETLIINLDQYFIGTNLTSTINFAN